MTKNAGSRKNKHIAQVAQVAQNKKTSVSKTMQINSMSVYQNDIVTE